MAQLFENVKVSSATKLAIKDLSAQLGVTQGDIIKQALEVAKTNNWQKNNDIKTIVSKEVNRVIGVITNHNKLVKEVLEHHTPELWAHPESVKIFKENLDIVLEESTLFKDQSEDKRQLNKGILRKMIYKIVAKCMQR